MTSLHASLFYLVFPFLRLCFPGHRRRKLEIGIILKISSLSFNVEHHDLLNQTGEQSLVKSLQINEHNQLRKLCFPKKK